MLRTLAVQNYRSIRDLSLELEELNLITGANGVGKSNLYRSLRLLAACARGGVVSSLAAEGGMAATLWAGPETIPGRARRGEESLQGSARRTSVALRLGFATDEFGYAIDLGYPGPTGAPTQFTRDPQIKGESIWAAPRLRPSTLLTQRRNHHVALRRPDGEWRDVQASMDPGDSILAQLADPEAAPEILTVREQVRGWRFYDHVRTDADAPARTSRIGTWTPVLAADGADLAAAIQTIIEIGDRDAFDEAIDSAFPGSRAWVEVGDDGRFDLRFEQPGLLRPLTAADLSDGTLRFVLWAAALLTPRVPPLMVLNEPETSLHPDLLPALASIIVGASQRTQVVVVTHAPALADALRSSAATTTHLIKDFGETLVEGRGRLEGPAWSWPKR